MLPRRSPPYARVGAQAPRPPGSLPPDCPAAQRTWTRSSSPAHLRRTSSLGSARATASRASLTASSICPRRASSRARARAPEDLIGSRHCGLFLRDAETARLVVIAARVEDLPEGINRVGKPGLIAGSDGALESLTVGVFRRIEIVGELLDLAGPERDGGHGEFNAENAEKRSRLLDQRARLLEAAFPRREPCGQRERRRPNPLGSRSPRPRRGCPPERRAPRKGAPTCRRGGGRKRS